MPRPRRLFPADLKAQIVLQLLTGAATQAELCRKHNIKPQLLSHWKDAVIERMHTLKRDGSLS
jgi:transposase-like protein